MQAPEAAGEESGSSFHSYRAQVPVSDRRSSFAVQDTLSFKGPSGDRVLRTLSDNSKMGAGPLTFDNVLSSRAGIYYFLKFCSNEDNSSESSIFLMEGRNYQKIGSGMHREVAARKIFAKFFDTGAPTPLSVPQELRARLKEAIHSFAGPKQDTFDEVLAEVAYTLRYDVFPRFVSSPQYFKLLNLTLEEHMRFDIAQYDLYRLLGAGGFGMVLLARRRSTRNYFACKVIDKRIIVSQNQIHAVFREKEVLAALDHPFVVGLHCAFQTEHHLCLVMDFVEGGNMYTDLLKGAYSLARTVFYTAQLCLAIEYIHSLGILYRDLKPDNVLLDMSGYCRLGDMGAARGVTEDGFIAGHLRDSISAAKTVRVRNDADADLGSQDGSSFGKGGNGNGSGGGSSFGQRSRRMTITGTHGYRAPEVYEREYGKEADWWNVGLLIVEMLTQHNPLRGVNRKESELLTKTKQYDPPSSLGRETCSVVRAFLHPNPTKRLGTYSEGQGGFDAIKGHSFFATPVQIEWMALLEKRMVVPFAIESTNLTDTALGPQRKLTPETNQIDYFSQTVDYMLMSIKMRRSWVLSADEHRLFDAFDFVSSRALEEELDEWPAAPPEERGPPPPPQKQQQYGGGDDYAIANGKGLEQHEDAPLAQAPHRNGNVSKDSSNGSQEPSGGR